MGVGKVPQIRLFAHVEDIRPYNYFISETPFEILGRQIGRLGSVGKNDVCPLTLG
jgi:hypothetical protein